MYFKILWKEINEKASNSYLRWLAYDLFISIGVMSYLFYNFIIASFFYNKYTF